MRYRKLGRQGIRVSEVGLGGWLTHGRSLEDGTTTAIVRRAFDLGVNFFDTADAYNAGEAEKSLAVAVEGIKREDLVLATKCFFPISDAPNDRGLSRKHIVESVHNSLRRLKTDYLDLMQFHRYDPEVGPEEIVRAIDDLVRQGKVLYWGVSEWNARQIAEIALVARDYRAVPPASNQPAYNLLNRNIEDSVVPTSLQYGLGQVVFSPLAQGVLTGKYKPGAPPAEGTRAADDASNMFMRGMLEDGTLERVERLRAHVEAEHGLPLGRFALAWCLRQPNVSSVIVGATRVEQIEENVLASGIELPADAWLAAERVLSGEAG